MNNRRNPIIFVGLSLIVVVSGYLIYDNFIVSDPVIEAGINNGDMLLDQTIPNIDGSESVSFSDYRGSVLIIDFMAPWCPPCIGQISILREIELIEGVEVLSINIDPNYEMAFLKNFRTKEGINWFFGHNPKTAIDFEVTGIPTLLIVDQRGFIVYRGFYTTIKDFDTILADLID
jgi:thiol-disulfide isomerase/thioredoxin